MRIKKMALISGLAMAIGAWAQQASAPQEARPRARELGIQPGRFTPGSLNAITDVPGVKVGQETIVEGDTVRTGVTAILPHGGNLFREKVPAAIYVFNAFGKLVGGTQVEELGQLETPIVLTNTLSVWDAAAATAEWMLRQPGNENVRSINPVVGETNDGWLSDIRGRHVKSEHVRRAIESAKEGPVEEGSVGAGTGTMAFGWKGGIGTSSRRVEYRSRIAAESSTEFTVGVLVQTNFGGRLTINGVPVWKSLVPLEVSVRREEQAPSADGSCMVVVATDAPLDARQLRRLAARAMHGMARTGSSGSHGSGDYVISFSTIRQTTLFGGIRRPAVGQRVLLVEDDLSSLFEAVIEATEEAIYNSLLRATTVRGRDGHTAQAIPIAALEELLKRWGSGEVRK
jgi:D-aminopeptidase